MTKEAKDTLARLDRERAAEDATAHYRLSMAETLRRLAAKHGKEG